MGGDTLYGCFAARAAATPERPFLEVLPETAAAYGIAAETISYAEACARVEARIAPLRAAGYGPRHRVGLLLMNRPEFLWNLLALNALGATAVPINPDYRRSELAYLCEHAELALAVAVPERQHELAAAAADVGRVLPLAGPEDEPPSPAPGSAVGQGEAALLYTSGTTGLPKGCLIDDCYFLTCGAWYAGLQGAAALKDGDRMLTPLPLFHMNALACSLMGTIAVGGCLILLDRFHPRTWWESVRAARATVIHYLGVMPAMLMGAPPAPTDREHQVRFGFGAGVEPELHAAFEARFGFPLVEAWAMTETGCAAAIIATGPDRKVGTRCFGRPGPGVEVRLIDEEGRDVPPGAAGELLVRRAGADPRRGFFRGYLKDPEATAAAWAGGWFHTGDVVEADAEGDLHFVDRRKNVIRRSGENIAAVEVEGLLAGHPAVARVAVAGVPDPIRGEEVMALVVPRARAEAGPDLARGLAHWCLERLAYYKAPGFVAFVDELPLTATAKIQRGALKALAHRLHAEAAVHDTRDLKKRGAR